ncbi:MAG: hypothetical protein KKH98_14120 [Spirochaetes bacterium]|nr:hypothetical protein [Spirochaetota bacterium]
MQKSFFLQLLIFIGTLLLIFMFFFPDYKYVQKMILNRIGVINMLLILGLYLKDLLKQ